jgi:Serine acetyltransferase
MIQSWKDFKEYYIQDLRATGLDKRSLLHRLKDRRYRFYKSLRFTEYIINCRPGFKQVLAKIFQLRHTRMCSKYQWTIPPNVFGPGLAIVHVGTIVVTGNARVGKNCRIHVCVNIGNAIVRGTSGAPVIGDNVYIGPGAKIFGPIIIGDNTAIGANAVVNKSFQDGNCTIAGLPAKVVSENTSSVYINIAN